MVPIGNPRAGMYRRTATLWLRVVAIIMLAYALSSIVYVSLESADQPRSFRSAVYYAVIGILLGLLGGPLGRLAAVGLDDPSESHT